MKDVQPPKNQADLSFATEIRDENLDEVMKEMYNRTIWTMSQNQGYAFAYEGACKDNKKNNKFSQ